MGVSGWGWGWGGGGGGGVRCVLARAFTYVGRKGISMAHAKAACKPMLPAPMYELQL